MKLGNDIQSPSQLYMSTLQPRHHLSGNQQELKLTGTSMRKWAPLYNIGGNLNWYHFLRRAI